MSSQALLRLWHRLVDGAKYTRDWHLWQWPEQDMRFHSIDLVKLSFFSDHFWRTSPCHTKAISILFLTNKHKVFITVYMHRGLGKDKIKEAFHSSAPPFLPPSDAISLFQVCNHCFTGFLSMKEKNKSLKKMHDLNGNWIRKYLRFYMNFTYFCWIPSI